MEIETIGCDWDKNLNTLAIWMDFPKWAAKYKGVEDPKRFEYLYFLLVCCCYGTWKKAIHNLTFEYGWN